jgi:hypothetical protein
VVTGGDAAADARFTRGSSVAFHPLIARRRSAASGYLPPPTRRKREMSNFGSKMIYIPVVCN